MVKFLEKLLKYPKSILIASLMITVVFFMFIKTNMRLETNLDKYMPQDHPAFVYSNKAEGWFDIKDGIILAFENKKGIYNKGTLLKIKKMTKELQRMKEIRKKDVTSLFTVDNIIGTKDGMDVKTFYNRVPATKKELKNLQQKVKANDMVFGRLVSADETVSVVIARIDKDIFSQEFYLRVLALAKKYNGEEKIYVAGRPIVEGTMAVLGPKDMKQMVPIVLLVIIVVLLFLLKNVKSTVLTLVVVIFSTLWAFGIMAVFKIPAYAVAMMIPVMLIAIGVADGIHLYSHLHLFQRHNPGATKYEAVTDMLKEMWKPVVVTSVTTAVGFISLLSSEVYPIKYFGIFTAAGVMVAMAFSLLLIPAGILVFGLPKLKEGKLAKDMDDEDQIIQKKRFRISGLISETLLKKRYLTMGITTVILVLSLWGMSNVWINSSFLEKFEKNSDIVLTDKFINQYFGGTSTLNVILEGKSDGIFKSPEVLKKMIEIQYDLEKNLIDVGDSFSLGDYILRMNMVMNEDKPEFNIIPNSRDLIAQYLLLYEMSGDPENLWQVVTEDYKKANMTFQLKTDNSKTLNAAITKVEKYKEFFKSRGITMKYAGSGYKGLVFTDLILEGQIKSIVLSLVIVVALLGLMFRSILVGFIGAIPIVITAIISFGVMGLFNIALSTTTALVSSIAIGIGIDYSVHFIERYKIYADMGKSKDETTRLTMQHSGRAITFNAVVVILGFLVLMFSVFPPNRELGMLVSLNMFTSFIGTLTIMFLALYLSGKYFPKKK